MTSVVTWSNAVFTAILPHISDFAQRAELPIPHPITAAQVQKVFIMGTDRVEGDIRLTNGYEFMFEHGYVRLFSTPTGRDHLYNKNPIRLNRNEAIERARTIIRNLGYSEEQLYVNFPPKVELPWKYRGDQFACYEITWQRPNFDNLSVQAKIDGTTGDLVGLFWLGRRLERPDPIIGIDPPPRRGGPKPGSTRRITNAVEQTEILRRAIPLINETIANLKLPISAVSSADALKLDAIAGPRPSPPGHGQYGEETNGVVTCGTNGFSFPIYSYGHEFSVRGYDAADCFFTADDIDVNAFVAKAKLSKRQAVNTAKAMIKRFNPKIDLPSKYEIVWPNLPRDVSVPRCEIKWDSHTMWAIAEVDLGSGEVKSIYISP